MGCTLTLRSTSSTLDPPRKYNSRPSFVPCCVWLRGPRGGGVWLRDCSVFVACWGLGLDMGLFWLSEMCLEWAWNEQITSTQRGYIAGYSSFMSRKVGFRPPLFS